MAQIFVSGVAHFFVVVGGSKIHERMAHFFIDIYSWTHNIINLSDTEDLVTVMTCNEIFDPNHPDTFGEPV